MKIDPAVTPGTWEGRGTSLSWMGSVLGDREDTADFLFTDRVVTFNNTEIPGLGAELDRPGLQDVLIAASDETHYDPAAAWKSFGPEVKAITRRSMSTVTNTAKVNLFSCSMQTSEITGINFNKS